MFLKHVSVGLQLKYLKHTYLTDPSVAISYFRSVLSTSPIKICGSFEIFWVSWWLLSRWQWVPNLWQQTLYNSWSPVSFFDGRANFVTLPHDRIPWNYKLSERGWLWVNLGWRNFSNLTWVTLCLPWNRCLFSKNIYFEIPQYCFFGSDELENNCWVV